MPLRGDRLKAQRESHGFTQEDLAERTGIAQPQIGRYETGKVDPSSSVLAKLSQALEVTADYLLGLVDDPGKHLTARELSPDESRLLDAYRRGEVQVMLRIIAEADQPPTKEPDKPRVPGS